jgi:ABC-type lipoprotein release transport system permease subunit
MLTQIAWRNVWRSKGRSSVVIGSMVIGIWAMAFGGGFMRSFLISYIATSIKHETSNGQVHHPEFKKDFNIQYTIDNPERVMEGLKKTSGIEYYTSRSIVNGMVSSARQATGVKIVGVDPTTEAQVTELDTLVSEGEYFPEMSNAILIGEKLAEKLKVKVKSKVVLTFQDLNGNITAARFRVAGILHSTSISINESSAFVLRSDLNRLLNIGEAAQEIAYTTIPDSDDDLIAAELKSKLPTYSVESWRELSPALVFMEQWMAASLKVLIIIIMSALAFGIINTMLMAVLERIHELGMLMALGMKRGRVFIMVMLETIFLSTIGGPLGLLAGYGTIRWLAQRGIDLTDYSEGLEAIGYESVLYPVLNPLDYFQIVVGVLITAILASIYPAWKAISVKPVEALHHI